MSIPAQSAGRAARGASPSSCAKCVESGMSEVVSTGLVTRTRNHLSEPLFRNAYSLMVNSILNAGLGLGFWIVAARIYPSEQVGRDSALVAAMVTMSTICQLNLGNAIPRFMPLVADPARALRKLYAVSIGLALVLSTGFVAPRAPPRRGARHPQRPRAGDQLRGRDVALGRLRAPGRRPHRVAARAVGAPGECGVRRAEAVSLPLLFALGIANGVFGSWLGPMLLLLIPMNALIFLRVIPAHRRAHPERSARLEDIDRGQLTRFLAQDFGANAFFLGGVAILPLLILSILGSTQNAYYYVALTIILGLEALVSNAGMSLTVESAFEGHRLRGLARVVFKRSLMLMVPCALLLIVAAPILLSPFGEDYAREATPLLRILGVAVVFRTVILVFQAVARSRGRGRSLLVVDVVLFSLLIGLTVVLTPPFGLEGAGLAWLISNGVMALAVAPSLIRFLMSTHQPEIAFAPAGAPAGTAGLHDLESPAETELLALVTRAPGGPESADEAAELVDVEELETRQERRRPPPPPLSVGPLWLLVIAAAACVASVALMAAGAHGGVLTVALVLMLSLAPGAALLPFIGARDDALGLGLVLGTSLAISTVGAEIMLWTGWEPRAASYGLAAVCLPPILLTLRTEGFLPRSFGEATGFDAVARVGRPSDGPLAKTLRRPTTQALILAAAAAAWILGMWTTDLGDISGWGLLTALGGAWYLGLLVLIVGFALTVWATPAIPGIFAAYITGLVLMLHGTTALLYDVPRYVWTYKHLGVVEEIMAQGHVDRTLDVYNNWPGFFALSAWLSESAGVEPITFAAWAQVFFSLGEVAVLLFALRGLGVSERVRWTAAWLFVVADWIGQNYFAPQALAFLLSLVVLALCLRCAPPRRGAERRWFDRWLRRRRRRGPLLSWLADVRKGVGLPESAPPLPARSALLVGTLVYLAVVVSHQLSPILLIAQVVAIALIGGRLPLWVPVAMLAIEVWWISTTWSFVGDHFNLFDINPGARPEAPPTPATPGCPAWRWCSGRRGCSSLASAPSRSSASRGCSARGWARVPEPPPARPRADRPRGRADHGRGPPVVRRRGRPQGVPLRPALARRARGRGLRPAQRSFPAVGAGVLAAHRRERGRRNADAARLLRPGEAQPRDARRRRGVNLVRAKRARGIGARIPRPQLAPGAYGKLRLKALLPRSRSVPHLAARVPAALAGTGRTCRGSGRSCSASRARSDTRDQPDPGELLQPVRAAGAGLGRTPDPRPAHLTGLPDRRSRRIRLRLQARAPQGARAAVGAAASMPRRPGQRPVHDQAATQSM